MKTVGYVLTCLVAGLVFNLARAHYNWSWTKNVVVCVSRANNVEAALGITSCQWPITNNEVAIVVIWIVIGWLWFKD